jgi:hypothetical protein
MTLASKRSYLVAEKATLENLVARLPAESILERVGLVDRLSNVTAELASLPALSGRTADEDVLSASVQALQERDQAEHERLADARREAEDGFAALDRGESVRGSVDDLMARVDAAVRTRAR